MKLYDELTEQERDIVDYLRKNIFLSHIYTTSIVEDFCMQWGWGGLQSSTAINKFRRILKDLEMARVVESRWIGTTYYESGDITQAKRTKLYKLTKRFENFYDPEYRARMDKFLDEQVAQST